MVGVPEHVGAQLKRVRTSRRSLEGEVRRHGGVLSREVLARRTGRDGYVTVSAETIKSAEESATTGVRLPDDDTLASLYHELEARPDEFPAGALAEARYLVSRWLDERHTGVQNALRRRAQVLQLLAADELATQPPGDSLTGRAQDAPRSHRTGPAT